MLAGSCWHCSVVLRRSAGSAQAPAAFDSTKAWEHLRQQVAIGPRPSGSPANVKNRDYIKAQLAALGIKTVEQPFDGAHAARPGQDGQPDRDHPRPAPRAHRPRQPLRHQAVPRVPLRRRQRRRLEHRGADRAGARAQGARRSCPSRSSCCSSTAKKRSSSGRAPTTPTAAATTWRRRASPAR